MMPQHPSKPPHLDEDLPTVGLFGYYGKFNFGDDLMALLFMRQLLSRGHRTVIYGYTKPPIDNPHLSVTKSLDHLCEISDCIIVGGGGAFIPNSKNTDSSHEIGKLVERCEALGVSIACISVGGNGVPLDQIQPEARRRLAQNAELLVLRNRSEVDLFQKSGINAQFQNDVVWTTCPALGLEKEKNTTGRKTIAVNLYPSAEHKPVLNQLFESISQTSGGVDWVFLETHTFGPEWWQAYRPEVACSRFTTHQFKKIEPGLAFIQQCDVMITSRLHAGIAAMSYGKPCIALDAVPKTRLAFHSLGLSDFCWQSDQSDKLLSLDTPDGTNALEHTFNQFDRKAVSDDAMKNYELMLDWLASHSRS
jgi:polysaccharide pyruvyl transferase WcaK-like protein